MVNGRFVKTPASKVVRTVSKVIEEVAKPALEVTKPVLKIVKPVAHVTAKAAPIIGTGTAITEGVYHLSEGRYGSAMVDFIEAVPLVGDVVLAIDLRWPDEVVDPNYVSPIEGERRKLDAERYLREEVSRGVLYIEELYQNMPRD
jgi:hypothetical protein